MAGWAGDSLGLQDDVVAAGSHGPHCLSSRFQDPGMWAAYTGTTSLRGTDSSAVKMDISQIIPHPSYNADTADYDVAVLELKRPVTFTKYIQPVCLPDAGHHFPTSKKCLISGWGYLKEDFCKQSMTGSRGDLVGCGQARRHRGREPGPCSGQLWWAVP